MGRQTAVGESGTFTFLFSDIEGSTQLLRELGDKYSGVLARHHEVLRAAFEAHSGEIVDTEGDGCFVAFEAARQAAAAAVAGQRALWAQAWPQGRQLRVRMGLHSGDADRTPGGIVGMAVHRAARVCAAAHGGQILMSELTSRLAADGLPLDARLIDLGLHQLRDFDEPQRVHQLWHPDLPASFPLIRSTKTLETEVRGVVLMAMAEDPAMPRVRRLLGRSLWGGANLDVAEIDGAVVAVLTGTRQALESAVRLQQRVERHNRSNPEGRVDVRVAIDLLDSDVSSLGAGARRLCERGRDGQILTTLAVASAVRAGGEGGRSPRLTPIGAPSGREPIVEVAWTPTPAPVLPASIAVEHSPFVGRIGELGSLRRAWARAQEGQLQVVFVQGEPGIGKTRLARALAVSAHEDGATVLYGRCYEDSLVPYEPFVECLSQCLSYLSEGSMRELVVSAPELRRILPELGRDAGRQPAPGPGEQEDERYRLFEAVATLLDTAALEGDVVMLLEDLHWADQSTLRLLLHLTRGPTRGPQLILGTYRDTEVTFSHPLNGVVAELRRTAGLERIVLKGLDDDETADLVEGMETGLSRCQALFPVLQRQTAGNPLFLGELVRHLVETHALGRHEGIWQLDRGPEETGVPTGIREVIAQRFARLAQSTMSLLSTASVIGYEFPVDVLERVTGLSADDVLEALAAAADAGIVRDALGSAGRLSFSHAMVRETLYREILTARRLRLHGRVLVALEGLAKEGRDVPSADLSHHAFLAAQGGDDPARAGRYAVRAARDATAAFAYDEAVAQYQRAIEALDLHHRDDAADRCELLLGLGEAQRLSGNRRYRQTLLDAYHLAEAVGDAGRMAKAALANNRGFTSTTSSVDEERVAALKGALRAAGEGDSPVRARLLANLAVELVYGDDFDDNRRRSDEAVTMARRLSDPVSLALVLAPRYNTIRGDPGTLPERLANTAELVALTARSSDPTLVGTAQVWRGLAAMEAADLDEADRCFASARDIAAKVRQPTSLWYTSYCQAGRSLFAGRFDEAECLSVEALRLGQAAGHRDARMFAWLQGLQLAFERGTLQRMAGEVARAAGRVPAPSLLRSWQALVYCELDRAGDARSALEQLAPEDFARYPFEPAWLHVLANYAAVCSHLGSRDHAAALIDLIRPYADQLVTMTSLAYCGVVAHYLGLLAATLCREEEADSQFAKAVAGHRRMGAPAWLARTQLEWGRLLIGGAAASRRTDGRRLLEDAHATAKSLGVVNVRRRARALLDSMPV